MAQSHLDHLEDLDFADFHHPYFHQKRRQVVEELRDVELLQDQLLQQRFVQRQLNQSRTSFFAAAAAAVFAVSVACAIIALTVGSSVLPTAVLWS